MGRNRQFAKKPQLKFVQKHLNLLTAEFFFCYSHPIAELISRKNAFFGKVTLINDKSEDVIWRSTQ